MHFQHPLAPSSDVLRQRVLCNKASSGGRLIGQNRFCAISCNRTKQFCAISCYSTKRALCIKASLNQTVVCLSVGLFKCCTCWFLFIYLSLFVGQFLFSYNSWFWELCWVMCGWLPVTTMLFCDPGYRARGKKQTNT